jgi:hypothetical protein
VRVSCIHRMNSSRCGRRAASGSRSVFGHGPVDLVCIPGFISNLYWNWELPESSRMLTGLGSFARVAILDQRGVSLSDRLSPQATLDELPRWQRGLAFSVSHFRFQLDIACSLLRGLFSS